MLHPCSKKRSRPGLTTLFLGVLVAFAAACGLSAPTPTPKFSALTMDPTAFVSASLDEQILRSNTIVRASLLSAAAGVETVPSDPGVNPTYRPVQELKFRIHEYLEGSGSAELVVVVPGDHTYMTEAEARQSAETAVSQRNTAWDGREGVLFLNTLQLTYAANGASDTSGASQPEDASVFTLTLSNQGAQSNWEYAIDTLSRAWLPARDAGGAAGQSSEASGTMFITDGSQSPPPVVSLAELRSRITEIDAMLKAGEGIEGYEDCIYHKLTRERHYRNDPYVPPLYSITLNSGSPAGIEIYRETILEQFPNYFAFWLSGPDMEFFQASIADDDSSAQNGYDHTLVTLRPFPAGEYQVFYNWQHWDDIPCNFKPADAYDDWTVKVIAPSGTMHEAFFDPADGSGVVGFSADVGRLEPRELSSGNSVTAVQSLLWNGGSVALTLEPYLFLSGQSLDFIALDGSVALTLEVSAATADSAAGSLTWALAQQPWQDGDRLMLRIRQSVTSEPATPTPAMPEPTATPIPPTPELTATPEPATPTPEPATPTPEPATPTPEPATATPPPTPTPTPAPATPTPVPLSPPPVPSGLAASASGADSVALSWTALAGASHYGVYRYFPASSELPAFWGKVSENVAEASYTVTGLDCETEYHYGIAAHGDGVTYSASWGPGFSDPVAVTTGACSGPGT